MPMCRIGTVLPSLFATIGVILMANRCTAEPLKAGIIGLIFPTESGQDFSEYRGDAIVRTRLG